MKALKLLFIVSLICFAKKSFAGSLSVRVGPQQIGNGGSYPLWIPPVGIDQYAFTWVTNSNFETTLSLYPGLLLGRRFQAKGFFVSMGGGLIIASGGGPGIYSTFGYETGEGSAGFHFTTDYTQALGYEPKTKKYQAPSSMRFGFLWRY